MDIAKKSDSRTEPGICKYRAVLVAKPNQTVIRFNQEGVVTLALEFPKGDPQMSAHHALLDNPRDNVCKRSVTALIEISTFCQ